MATHYITLGQCHLLLTLLLCLGTHRIIAQNPSDVTNVNTTDITDNSFTVSWTAPSDGGITNYTVILNNGANIINETNTTTTIYEASGLSPGVTYTITIRAYNATGTSSGVLYNITTLPSPATGLEVSSESNDSVTLSWMFPSDSNSNSYNYTVSDGVTNQTVHGTNTATIQNLKPGTEYNFTVYAVTPNGVQSKPSNVVTATTQPNTVQGVTILTKSETTVTLQWTLSQDPNNNTYTYTVEVRGPNVSNLLNTTSNSEVVRDLLPGVNYNFTVFAVTKNGVRSQPSITVTATTVPSHVTDLKVTSISSDSVTLSWMFSSDSNSNSYNYTVSDGVTNQTVHGTNTATIQNLKPGTEYNFTVYAVTPNGVQSKPSNVVTVTTKPNIVQGVTILTVSETTVTLQWTLSQDPNNKTYTYTVDVQGPMFSNISNVMGNIEVVRNLLPGVDYNFTVFAVTKNGVISQSSITVTTTTMPNAPGNLQGIAVNVSEIYINWTAPNDVNKNLYDYKVTWVDAEAIQNIASYTTKDTFFYTTSLFPGHLYNITVKSVIKNTASVNAEIYTATQPISIQRLSASEVNNTSVTLSWIIPTYPNSVKTGYRVTVYLNGKNISEVETTDEKYVVNNLEPGNVYRISVESYVRYPKPGITARTSTTDNYITSYSIPSLIESETDPDPVNDLKCSKMDAYQIKVEFMCPRGNYSTFKVLVNDLINNEVNTCIDNVVVSNLQPAASYKIRVMTIATAKNSSTVYIICSTDNTGVIVGSIFGVLLFILLIALIVFLVLRSRRLKNRSENIPTTFTGQRRFHTIPREKFKQHYENNHADSDFGFAEEYQELSSVGTTQSKRAAELPDNRAKNRFTNVLPYDHSRVKLSIVNGILSTDYINANYMPGYNSNKEFIACQGPLPNTTADFWRMVCEHHVNTIVMLTNCMENGRVKCEHYWPLDYTPCTYGDLTVTVTSETILSEWTIRDFSVKHATQPGIKYVRHFHYTAWPDHGVPDSTSSIMQFHNLVREYMDQRKSNGPTVVHCSAGVGRTGTLIALDYLIQQNEREHRIGVYGFVEKMRMNRNLMVQTEAQYIFLNKCMLDLIDQPEDEHIYENHTGNELVYENVSAIRNLHRENA
ncbi:receptor-type tyrosine-protein phosphatase H isoform X2 [Hyla sarda]|uniref:receptor-type tyrosine-protein phosphatase H isoform X2 n=1 Tax=Hyla sarda TaxID=327740 RepID=UPI0024C4057A|nr:receptor-type tyrosine-protein phosphatase H isoform X2 [Hyla sarda]